MTFDSIIRPNIIKGFKDLSGGRWVTTEDGNHIYIKGGKVMSGNKDGENIIQKVLDKKEDEIRNLDYERAVVVYSDGTTTEIDGQARQADVSSLEKKKCLGQIFTHNHPSWINDENKRLSPLSLPDISTALNLGFKEFRAVGNKGDSHSIEIDKKITIFGKTFTRGNIDLEYVLPKIRNVYEDHFHEGQDMYIKQLNEGKSQNYAQRSAMIHHLRLFYIDLQNKIKGIKFKINGEEVQ